MDSAAGSADFCTYDNIQSAAVYLSQELQAIGIRCKIIESSGERLNLLSLINSCWHLTKLYNKAIKDNNQLHDQRCRDTADISHNQVSIKELRDALNDKDRHIQEVNEKDRQMSTINNALASKLKLEKDEVKKLNSLLHQKEAQHNHELKKHELECAKLKEKLLRLVSGERSNRSSSLTMTGSLDRQHKLRSKWKTETSNIKHEEELYRKIFARYEVWIEQLTEEIQSLKDFMSNMLSKIHKISLKTSKSMVDSMVLDQEINGPLSDDSLEETPILSMPFVSLKEKIQRQFDEDLTIIQSALDEKRSDEDNVILGLHEEMLTEGLMVEEKEQFAKQLKRLQFEKKQLQDEKDKLALSMSKINKERASLEAEKVELLRTQFLNDLPDNLQDDGMDMCNDMTCSLTDLYGDSPRQLPSDPYFTSPKGLIKINPHPITLGRTHRTGVRNGRSSTSSRTGSNAPSTRSSAPSTRTPSLNRMNEIGLTDRNNRIDKRTTSAPHSPINPDKLFPFSKSESLMTRSLNSSDGQAFDTSDIPNTDSGISLHPGTTNARLNVLETSLMSLIDKITLPNSRPSSTYDESEAYNFNIPDRSRISTPMVKKDNKTLMRPNLPSKFTDPNRSRHSSVDLSGGQ